MAHYTSARVIGVSTGLVRTLTAETGVSAQPDRSGNRLGALEPGSFVVLGSLLLVIAGLLKRRRSRVS
jgi:hypothetical protein